jgi:hypothetical protein
MNTLKEKIVDKLEIIPEIDLQEILDFVDFLAWRKMTRSKSLSSDEEVLNWQQEPEKEEDELVHYVDGVLVVKSPSKETRINPDLDTSVNEVREERLRRLASW